MTEETVTKWARKIGYAIGVTIAWAGPGVIVVTGIYVYYHYFH